MTRAALIVIAVLMVIIAFLLFAWMGSRKNAALKDDKLFEHLRRADVEYRQNMSDIHKGYGRLLNMRDHRQDSIDRINAALLTENKRLRSQIRPVSVVMAGDTAGMRAQLTLRDQAIDNCDSSLSVRSGELAQAKAFTVSIQAIEARKDTVQERAISALNAAAWDNAKRAEKLEKKLDNPWSFGLHAGYGATMAGGQVYTGPQIGGGVQYKIRLKRRR